jgi:hypothetical protein
MAEYKLPFADTQRTDPDVEAQLYNRGSGNWSVYVEESFEKHLRDLYLKRTTKLWHGAAGLPKLNKPSWNSPYGINDKV